MPSADHAIMVIASLRYENSTGIAHNQVCWLLTFEDNLVYRSRDYASDAAARAAYAEHGIDIGIHERT